MARQLHLVLLAFVALGIALSNAATPKISDLRLDSILNNKRLLDAHLKCYLDKGPCTGEIKNAKKKLSEVMETNCGTCNAEEKRLVKKAMNKLNEIRPQGFQELMRKYDPTNKHRENFQKWLKST